MKDLTILEGRPFEEILEDILRWNPDFEVVPIPTDRTVEWVEDE